MYLLHNNKLPLIHAFAILVGFTSGPNTFTSPIEKSLHGLVSTWSVVKYQTNFFVSKLPTHVVNALSTDQYYTYRICYKYPSVCSIFNGAIEDDLLYLKVGPIVHLRWLTFGYRTLCYYMSLDKSSPTLKILVHFCSMVFFPT